MDWVLTAMSKDRPGVVEDIAAVISKHQGNWINSSMSRLGGEFAGIVQYSVPKTQADDLATELLALKQKGIHIVAQPDEGAQEQAQQARGETVRFELTGIDHPGIMTEITHLLTAKNVTIEQLKTGIFSASMAGEPMFYAKAKLHLPKDLSAKQLQEATETIAQDIMVEINLEIQDDEAYG